MLFPVRSTTKKSKIFTALNELLGYFLRQSIDASTFEKALFEPILREAIWSNIPTKAKFEKLWNALQNITRENRLELSNTFNDSQSISHYFSNKLLALPNMDSILGDLEILTKHLFKDTYKLVDVIAACGESLQDHFNDFRAKENNGNICICCGTEVLAQYRENIGDDEQWRGPYDHLLAKSEYPIFAVHPKNLLPICYTCNSKAKLAKDLLRDPLGNRRFSFFVPENAHEYVSFQINDISTTEIGLSVKATSYSPDSTIMEKLTTWNAVYDIKNRVEGEFSSLIEKLSEDFTSSDFVTFRAALRPKADDLRKLCRLSPWNFWKYKLYEWLDNQNTTFVQAIWEAMIAKRDDPNAFAVFGI